MYSDQKDLIIGISPNQEQKTNFNSITPAVLAHILTFLPSREILPTLVVSKLFSETYKSLTNPTIGKIFVPLIEHSSRELDYKDRVLEEKIENIPSIYGKALKLMCCLLGGGMQDCSLSAKTVKFCRLAFAGFFGFSSFAFDVELKRNQKNDNNLFTWGVIMGVTGVTLILDAGQSVYICYKKRKIVEAKIRLSEVSSLITRNPSINQPLLSDPVTPEQKNTNNIDDANLNSGHVQKFNSNIKFRN